MLSDHQTLTLNKGKPRKPYRKPHLDKLGDLRTLTLGGSPGTGDSGGGTFIEFPPSGHSIIKNLPPPVDLFGTPTPPPGDIPTP
jgi:hypothetical protein